MSSSTWLSRRTMSGSSGSRATPPSSLVNSKLGKKSVGSGSNNKWKKKKSGSSLPGGGGGGGGGISIKIKPYAKPPSLPRNFYSKTVKTLLRCTFAILRHEPLYVEEEEEEEEEEDWKKERIPPDSPKSITSPTAVGGVPPPALAAVAAAAISTPRDGTAAAAAGIKNSSTTADSAWIQKNRKSLSSPSSSRTSIGREELYRSVEDLCVHKYGPQLYRELIHAMDEAASECVRRSLLGRYRRHSSSEGEDAADSPPLLHYDDRKGNTNDGGCGATTDGIGVHFTNSDSTSSSSSSSSCVGGTGGSPKDEIMLLNSCRNEDHERNTTKILHSVYATYDSYVEYLICVRAIFLHLDRSFVYIPPPLEQRGLLPRTQDDADHNNKTNKQHQGGGTSRFTTTGRIIPRSSVGGLAAAGAAGESASGTVQSTSSSSSSSSSTTWNLWDVGIGLLRDHMTYAPTSTTTAAAAVSASEQDKMQEQDSAPSNKQDQQQQQRYQSIMSTLTSSIVTSLLAELDNLTTDKSLVRNCIRTMIDMDLYSSLFLPKLVDGMIHYFDGECKRWMYGSSSATTAADVTAGIKSSLSTPSISAALSNTASAGATATTTTTSTTTTTPPTMSSGGGGGMDVPSFLRHVDNRLRQTWEMTLYYLRSSPLPSSSSSSSTTLPTSTTTTSTAATTLPRRGGNRILTSIVERHLLQPHLTTTSTTNHGGAGGWQRSSNIATATTTTSSSILHPKQLYPLLDDENKIIPDIKRLFLLCKRIDNGLDMLRVAFGEYGRERGLGIVRFKKQPTTGAAAAAAAAGGGGGFAVGNDNSTAAAAGGGGAIVASNTIREAERLVIPNLLSLKAHLEKLHTLAFFNDDSFSSTLRGVWEDVLNAGSDDDDDADRHGHYQGGGGCGGDGGRKIAELLAKHIDLRFKNPKVMAASSPVGSTTAAAAAAASSTASSSTAMFGSAGGARGGLKTRGGLISTSDAGTTTSGGLVGTSTTATTTTTTTSADVNEQFMSAVMSLFRHIHSKDVFEAFYKRDLAKRLLLQKTTSTDTERAFLTLLKTECGGGYTSKMEGMFKDMDLSHEVMKSYASYCLGLQQQQQQQQGRQQQQQQQPQKEQVDMDVQVLTTGYWPVYPQYPSLILPPELTSHQERFESYYKTKYQGRRIAWQYSLGNCIVKARFPRMKSRECELIVSLCQTLVLLCFNDDDDGDDMHGNRKDVVGGGDGSGYTILDIMKRTGIEDRNEAERVLQSLSLGREGTRVLTKIDYDEDDTTVVGGGGGDDNEDDVNTATTTTAEASISSSSDAVASASPRGGGGGTKKRKKKSIGKKVRRSVSDRDRFVFNASFTSSQRRIKITNIQMKETAQERSKTVEAVSRDRLYLIDAAVVRIMKARKSIEHRNLMAEVMAQLKFPATAADIKKRVESLIEREYMERDSSDRTRYNYLA